MVFAEKLVFIMELTSTSNKQLGEALRVDPSLISRFRKATRSVPQKSEYFEQMGDYFANKCTTNYQLKALNEIIGNFRLDINTDPATTSAVISGWLSSSDTVNQTQGGTLLRVFDCLNSSDIQNTYSGNFACDIMENNANREKELFAFYGVDGRRKATNMFLQLALSSKRIGKIKILNEGNTDWVWSNKEFANKISSDIARIIYRGGTIIRIVPHMYNLAMVNDAISRWLILHTTGHVSSFYYPHMRDNVFCRTLYVMPENAALFSTSVGDKKTSDITFLTTNPLVVSALDREFMDFLSLCMPASILYRQEDSPLQIRNAVIGFLRHGLPSITILDGMSYLSTPPDVLDRIGKRFDIDKLKDFHSYCSTQFINKLSSSSFTEVFPLDSFENIISGKSKYIAFEALQNNEIFYTPVEYRLHLENIAKMLEQYPNYHVVLSKENEFNSTIYINEGHQVMLVRLKPSLAICNIEYHEMVSTMWSYALGKTKTEPEEGESKQHTISEMRLLIRRIDDYIKQQKKTNM